jgi:hypothetical protein
LHEARVPVGNCNSEPGPHHGALAWRERKTLGGRQIEPCVARIGPFGENGVGVQAANRDLDQADSRS